MKQWLRKKILKFLGIDELELKMARGLRDVNERFTRHKGSVDYELTRIGSCFNVGVDINPMGRDSWAIICTANKNDQAVLKFVDLHGADMRHIHDFLIRSVPRGANRYIDSPSRELLKRTRK